MDEGIVYAKDIHDCDDCPLKDKDCHGIRPNAGGMPIDPPCCSWNDNDEIFEGMYFEEVDYD